MRLMHKPSDEKRMVVILADVHYNDWLRTDAAQARHYLRHFPADQLTASGPVPSRGLF